MTRGTVSQHRRHRSLSSARVSPWHHCANPWHADCLRTLKRCQTCRESDGFPVESAMPPLRSSRLTRSERSPGPCAARGSSCYSRSWLSVDSPRGWPLTGARCPAPRWAAGAARPPSTPPASSSAIATRAATVCHTRFGGLPVAAWSTLARSVAPPASHTTSTTPDTWLAAVPTGNNNRHACLWTAANDIADLGTLGGTHINSRGDVVGWAELANGNARAFIRPVTGAMVNLGTFGGPTSRANGINDVGQVVGAATTAELATHAFVWTSSGGMVDLGTLGGDSSEAFAINRRGDIVGVSTTSDGQSHAFRWGPSYGMRDMGTLGGTSSVAHSINERGEVPRCPAQRRKVRSTHSSGTGSAWSTSKTRRVRTAPGSPSATTATLSAHGRSAALHRPSSGDPGAILQSTSASWGCGPCAPPGCASPTDR